MELFGCNVGNMIVFARKSTPRMVEFNVALSNNGATQRGHFGVIPKLRVSTFRSRRVNRLSSSTIEIRASKENKILAQHWRFWVTWGKFCLSIGRLQIHRLLDKGASSAILDASLGYRYTVVMAGGKRKYRTANAFGRKRKQRPRICEKLAKEPAAITIATLSHSGMP